MMTRSARDIAYAIIKEAVPSRSTMTKAFSGGGVDFIDDGRLRGVRHHLHVFRHPKLRPFLDRLVRVRIDDCYLSAFYRRAG